MINNNRGFILLLPAILVGVVAISAGTVAISQLALPGEPLYGLKTLSEQVRFLIAFTDSDKAQTHISIAHEKVWEIEKLQEKAVSKDTIKRAEQELEYNTSVASSIITSEKRRGENVDDLSHDLQMVIADGHTVSRAKSDIPNEKLTGAHPQITHVSPTSITTGTVHPTSTSQDENQSEAKELKTPERSQQ